MDNPVNVYGIAVAPVNFRRPAALFNGKVAPLQLMAARGVIGYQGEGIPQQWIASGHAKTPTALCSALVARHPVLGSDGIQPGTPGPMPRRAAKQVPINF